MRIVDLDAQRCTGAGRVLRRVVKGIAVDFEPRLRALSLSACRFWQNEAGFLRLV